MKHVDAQGVTRIWVIFKKLSKLQKMRVLAKLEKEAREERWDVLTQKLSRQVQDNPISDQEITQIVEEVRQQRYEQACKNRP